jgi:hypothetical protein
MSRHALLPDALELAAIERAHWPALLDRVRREGPTNVLLETMHIEGQDYTFKQLRHYIEKLAGVGQEGVIEGGDYKTTQRGAGANMSVDTAAGDAWVKMDTGTRNGLYLQTNDGVINTAVGAAHATLPRLDQLVIQANDSNVVGISNIPELKILAGTATGGATLDNRTGAAALGNDRLLIADILVPAAAASIVNANIRDRRAHARGAYKRIVRNANAAAGNDYSTASGTPVLIDGANLTTRVECGNANTFLRCILRGQGVHSIANGRSVFEVRRDGAQTDGQSFLQRLTTIGEGEAFEIAWDVTPSAAGSHVFAPYWYTASGGTATMLARATAGVQFVVEEIFRPSVDNT